MGFFDFIFSKSKPSSKQESTPEWLKPTPILDGLELPAILSDFADEISQTKLCYIGIDATVNDDINLAESKFGHYPMMPLDYDYPKDTNGVFMFPLAQINCNDLPSLIGYPMSGYLQFYISASDESYGINFDNTAINQSNFKVLYFEDTELAEYKTDFSFLTDIMNLDTLPVFKPHSLTFTSKEEYIGIGDSNYDEDKNNIQKIISKNFPDKEDDLMDYIYEKCSNSGHKIGGYAYFAQYDPREDEEKLKDYILLLQIDTDAEIMWGDSGVANFFINKTDLMNKDFSKVFYTWDCC